jgi:hypothetical protein
VVCPPGAFLKGEDDCEDDTLDEYNGGCNSKPPVFSPIPCDVQGDPVTVCGTYGGFTYFGSSYRDTDWYSIWILAPSNITFCVEGEYDTTIGIIDGLFGCPAPSFYDYAFAAPCEEVCLNTTLPVGEWWFFVATSGFGPSAGECGGDYHATLSGAICGYVDSVEPASWGSIKNLYR